MNKKLDGSRPFDPEEMQKRVSRLQREGKMPSLPKFLNAFGRRDKMGFGDDYVKRAMARDILTKLTCDMLLETFSPRAKEDVARFRAQTLEPIEFLSCIGDRLAVTSEDDYPPGVVEDAILSIAEAYDALRAEESPMKPRLRIVPQRLWRHENGAPIQ